jgi:signal transduction histidine kinase/ActR/RegA family two-component response regulator
MPSVAIGLSPAQFQEVFPFHVAFDRRGRLVSAGRALARICPRLTPGCALADVMTIERPHVPFELDALGASHTLFIIRLHEPEATLRGQMLVDHEAGTGLFLGSPWLTRIEEATALGLSLSDFPSHDAVGEFLLLFQTQQLALADAEGLADRLLTQRAELRVANQRLAEQERHLKEKNEALSRAARLKDEFLSSMSHELRTPLNAVIGMSESLIEGTYGDLDQEQCRALGLIESSGRHLLELINDILDLSRIEADRLELDLAEVDVTAVCRAAVAMVAPAAQKKDLTLRTMLDGAVSRVRADERRLTQILVNLLSNAVKFTPDGGAVTLSVTGQPRQGVLELAVTDTGIGIAAEDLPRLFQRFSQLDSSLARKHNGTGLGLVLTKRMAMLHGGDVAVESTAGRGSTFTVTLPWTAGARTAAPVPMAASPAGMPAPEAPAAEAAAHHLLIVDDNPGNLRVVADFLRARGYRVDLAASASEGIEMARATRPALILMDVQMPTTDGFEATRLIRQDPALAGTAIIALTSLAMKGDRERCLLAGMDDYISKPVKLTELLATIEARMGAPVLAPAKP